MRGVPFKRGFAVVLAAAGLFAFAACGGDGDDDARALKARSIVSSPQVLDEFLVTADTIAAAADGSVQEGLLRYWRDTQYQAWGDAAARYSNGLRVYLGDDRLILALQNQAGRFRSS